MFNPNFVATGLGSNFFLSFSEYKLSNIMEGVFLGIYPTPKPISGT